MAAPFRWWKNGFSNAGKNKKVTQSKVAAVGLVDQEVNQ